MTRRINRIKGTPLPRFDAEHAERAVLKVGNGRGFVMEIGLGSNGMTRIVITAAHCLEGLPPAMTFAAAEDKTYHNLLGPIDSEDLLVAAECLFADPVADLAVLGEPDTEVFYEEAEAFVEFMETATILPISSRIQTAEMPGYLLSLDGQWNPCTLTLRHGSTGSGVLWVKDAHEGICGGMSGSPILLDDGTALSLVCTADGAPGSVHREGGPMPLLAHALPAWLVQQLTRNVNS